MANIGSRKASIVWRIGFLVVLVVVALSFFHGISLGDIEEVLNNASILCLSCIGIG
jgi:hypothetical protein